MMCNCDICNGIYWLGDQVEAAQERPPKMHNVTAALLYVLPGHGRPARAVVAVLANCLEPLLITNTFFEDGCSLPGSCIVGRHQLPFPDGTG